MFGGYWPIQIISIRLIKQAKKFQVIIGALYYLDIAISTSWGYGDAENMIKVNPQWIGIIKDLFDFIISQKEENIGKYDNYIFSTFKCFVEHKRKLMIGLDDLLLFNKDFRNLIMGQLMSTHYEKDSISKMKGMITDINDMNLPKKQFLTIFHNLQQLELYLSSNLYFYIISLSSLSSIIKSHPSLKMVRIDLGYGSKIRSLYSLSEEMKKRYEHVGYNIHLEEEWRYGRVYNFCVIKRKI